MEDLWRDLRETAERIDPNAELVTPVSARGFRIEATVDDRFVVRFRDSGEERPLHREQFDVLVDRLDDGLVSLEDLPPVSSRTRQY
nr:hypothetical protein [Candidatus Halobonum tyrrellensis]